MEPGKVSLAKELGLPTDDSVLSNTLESEPADINWAYIRERLSEAFKGDDCKVASAIPRIDRLARLRGIAIYSSAGTVTDCSCGRTHERPMNPETGETFVDTSWY